MKKIVLLSIFFIIYTCLVVFCHDVTVYDYGFIVRVQYFLRELPIVIPLLPDFILYSVMIAIPLISGSIFYFKKKKYFNIILLNSIPLITFLLNCIIKPLIHRPRPPFEMQISIHPDSFSYVSSHSLITFCLWGIVIYFINKYIENKAIKTVLILLSVLWIVFVGFSRIWLGVHHPSDVLGAYILGLCLLNVYNLKRWV